MQPSCSIVRKDQRTYCKTRKFHWLIFTLSVDEAKPLKLKACQIFTPVRKPFTISISFVDKKIKTTFFHTVGKITQIKPQSWILFSSQPNELYVPNTPLVNAKCKKIKNMRFYFPYRRDDAHSAALSTIVSNVKRLMIYH